jgi:hypothetical protein
MLPVVVEQPGGRNVNAAASELAAASASTQSTRARNFEAAGFTALTYRENGIAGFNFADRMIGSIKGKRGIAKTSGNESLTFRIISSAI